MATTPGGKNPAAALNLRNRLHRYKRIFLKRWWVFLLCVCAAVAVQAYLLSTRPPLFQSVAKFLITGGVNVASSGSSGAREPTTEFIGTQIEIFRSNDVRRRASERVQALFPEMRPAPATIEITKSPAALILVAAVTSPDPVYAQRLLQAMVDSFLAQRKESKTIRAEGPAASLADEIARLDKEITADDKALIDFQKRQQVVIAEYDQQNLAKDLVRKKEELRGLRTEYETIQLLSPEQQLERFSQLEQRRVATASPGGDAADNAANARMTEILGKRSDYVNAQLTLTQLRAQKKDLDRFLKPKHPKILDLIEEIEKQERTLGALRENVAEDINSRREALRLQVQRFEGEVKEAEQRAIELNVVFAEANRLKERKERNVNQHRRLTESYNELMSSTRVDADIVSVLEQASPGVLMSAGALKAITTAIAIGLLAGLVILVVLDRMDDRINSLGEFQAYFAEPVFGQIPADAAAAGGDFLRADDTRPMLAESFRNIRSTLLYMPVEGERPRTLLITSAVPNEGKSTIATNLALVLAYAGIRTLLVDGDLRRGRIATNFGMPNEPGFSEVLDGSLKWSDAVKETSVQNLFVLPRGRTLAQPSEYLLSGRADQFLRDVYPEYDYIIVDTAPVRAADDTASLAPKMDAVLFVVRLSHTSAKMSRNSLEILYKRQANIPGLILNAVDVSSPEFTYYRYPEYYYHYQPKPEPKKAPAGA